MTTMILLYSITAVFAGGGAVLLLTWACFPYSDLFSVDTNPVLRIARRILFGDSGCTEQSPQDLEGTQAPASAPEFVSRDKQPRRKWMSFILPWRAPYAKPKTVGTEPIRYTSAPAEPLFSQPHAVEIPPEDRRRTETPSFDMDAALAAGTWDEFLKTSLPQDTGYHPPEPCEPNRFAKATKLITVATWTVSALLFLGVAIWLVFCPPWKPSPHW